MGRFVGASQLQPRKLSVVHKRFSSIKEGSYFSASALPRFFRKKFTVNSASTLFWSEIMQETRVSPYLKHLQKNALLYLQLLALLLLVLTLINPDMKKSTIVGAQTIFIVDTSATMLAGKEQSTFDAHKKEMQSLVEQLDGRSVTLITTGNAPQAVLQQETNVKTIEKTIQDLHVTYETAQIIKRLMWHKLLLVIVQRQFTFSQMHLIKSNYRWKRNL
ncbi:hypothetical protein LSPH24S_05750 [Lysinibacillus sphaericus]